jgi:chemotaxis methyl-accepting protein methylase
MQLLKRLVEGAPYGACLDVTILACSMGAEVYSIAWIIRSARPDIDLRLHAVEIYPELVKLAARAEYSMRRPTRQDVSVADALRQKKDFTEIPTSDWNFWIFERLQPDEIDSMFEVNDGVAVVRQSFREGITWHSGDAADPEIAALLGEQDFVFADRFLFHMMPGAAEKCLRNIDRFVKPGGYLFVAGVDLDVRTRIAVELGWSPVVEGIREIHDCDDVRSAWPMEYWALEPIDDGRPDWQTRYAAVFQMRRGEIPGPESVSAMSAASR